MKLKTSESCTAESEETVAVLPASQMETKKREKNFFSICVSNKEKQTESYLNFSFYFRCLLNCFSMFQNLNSETVRWEGVEVRWELKLTTVVSADTH